MDNLVSYYEFWSHALGVTAAQLSTSDEMTVTSGGYLERHGDAYIFEFSDLATGKHITAATEINQAKLKLDTAQEKTIVFRDLDFILEKNSDFTPVAVSRTTNTVVEIRELKSEHDQDVFQVFKNQCSEEDIDTLDFYFQKETALGLFNDGKLCAISRFVALAATPKIADITVVVAPEARGKGYSTLLVSKLIGEVLARGLIPKYRVAEYKDASIAVATRLGFKPRFKLVVWQP